MPHIGSDGATLSEGRTVGVTVKTQYGDACLDSDLPALCANAARGDDVLIVMMDG